MYQTEAKEREPGHRNDTNGPKSIIKMNRNGANTQTRVEFTKFNQNRKNRVTQIEPK